MIKTTYSHVQQSSLQTQNNNSFFKLIKTAGPYVIVSVIFESLSRQSILCSPETVAWVASKTFEAMKWTAMAAGAAHSFWVCSPYSQTTKISPHQKEIQALRAEIARLRQELAARSQKIVHMQ